MIYRLSIYQVKDLLMVLFVLYASYRLNLWNFMLQKWLMLPSAFLV